MEQCVFQVIRQLPVVLRRNTAVGTFQCNAHDKRFQSGSSSHYGVGVGVLEFPVKI